MSIRVDTTSLISGAIVVGNRGLGVLGSDVPSTGDQGAGYLYNDLTLPADAGKEVRGLILTAPAAGAFFAYEDSSFTLTGAPDGNYSFTYRLFEDGVDKGTATGSIIVGANVGSAAGTSSATGVGRSLFKGVGSAAGTSNAAGAGTSSGGGAAAGSSAGSSTATGVGLSKAAGSGSAPGTSSASGVGRSLFKGVGTASGTSTASGAPPAVAVVSVGSPVSIAASEFGPLRLHRAALFDDAVAVVPSIGSSAGLATVQGVGRSKVLAEGQAAGIATVLGVSAAVSIGVGSAQGTSSAAGIGRTSTTVDVSELIQQLAPGSIIEMFELDVSSITGTDTSADHFYFHAGTNSLNQPVVWQGKAYQPFPVQAEGFEVTTKGTLPRPRFRGANVTGALSALNRDLDDLVGAKVTRRRTFVRYLDAINFPGNVNVNADPNQYLADEVFYVERKVSEDKQQIEWELASAMDLEGVKLPFRIISVNYCVWDYRSPECSYTGDAYFDVADNPTDTLAHDVCSKSVNGCKKRFGDGVLPFGGFPSAKAYKF